MKKTLLLWGLLVCPFLYSEEMCSLYNSTEIIEQLIKEDKMHNLLEDTEEHIIDSMVKNFSPAEIALEAEVLNCTDPVLMYFDTTERLQEKEVIQLAKNIAEKHDLKVVLVDAEKFFCIVEHAEITKAPTWALVKGREIAGKLEGEWDIQKVENFLSLLDEYQE